MRKLQREGSKKFQKVRETFVNVREGSSIFYFVYIEKKGKIIKKIKIMALNLRKYTVFGK